jgi:hypothetical protein
VPGRQNHDEIGEDVCVIGAGIHNEPVRTSFHFKSFQSHEYIFSNDDFTGSICCNLLLKAQTQRHEEKTMCESTKEQSGSSKIPGCLIWCTIFYLQQASGVLRSLLKTLIDVAISRNASASKAAKTRRASKIVLAML